MAKGVRRQIDALRSKIDDLAALSRNLSEQNKSKAAELAEKEQRTLRLQLKSDKYVEELSQLEIKLKQQGFDPKVTLSAACNHFPSL